MPGLAIADENAMKFDEAAFNRRVNKASVNVATTVELRFYPVV